MFISIRKYSKKKNVCINSIWYYAIGQKNYMLTYNMQTTIQTIEKQRLPYKLSK